MTAKVRGYPPLLKEAIAEAKAAGVDVAALESSIAAAFTTSSKMFQEHGLAIRRFLKENREGLPPSARTKLEAGLTETERAFAGGWGLMALLGRRRYAGLSQERRGAASQEH